MFQDDHTEVWSIQPWKHSNEHWFLKSADPMCAPVDVWTFRLVGALVIYSTLNLPPLLCLHQHGSD